MSRNQQLPQNSSTSMSCIIAEASSWSLEFPSLNLVHTTTIFKYTILVKCTISFIHIGNTYLLTILLGVEIW